MCHFIIYQQMVVVSRVFDIAIRAVVLNSPVETSPDMPILSSGICQRHTFRLNVAERRDVHSRFIQGIYAVIDRYIPHVMLWEENFEYNPQSDHSFYRRDKSFVITQFIRPLSMSFIIFWKLEVGTEICTRITIVHIRFIYAIPAFSHNP